jgi:peptidoglycan-associated lipoprotein
METNYPYLKEGSFLDESFVETLSLQQQEIADQINRRCEFKVLKTTYKLF